MVLHHHRQHRRKQFFWIGTALAAIVIGLLAFSFAFSRIGKSEPHSQKVAQPVPPPPNWSAYFASTTLAAKAAYVVDLSTGETLFSKNADEPLPLASLTKLMTTAVALNTATTTTIVAVTHDAVASGEGDSGLYVDERWRLGDLIRYTLVVSSNSGAISIAQNIGALTRNPAEAASQSHLDAEQASSPAAAATPNAAVLVWATSTTELANDEAVFVQAMNQFANTLGLTSARFFNPSGLDLDAISAGAYSSAQDVSKLLVYLAVHYPGVISATRFPTITVSSLNNISHTGKNTDILSLQGLNLIASKTGYTDLAGGNLGIITDIGGHPVVIVVMSSTYEERFSDVATLASTSALVISAGE